METPTYDEIELIRESVCDGCKGVFTLHETGCYERCELFHEELQTIREEENAMQQAS